MNECPICSYPMVWSDDRRRQICAIYGTHSPPAQPIHMRPTLVLLADIEQAPEVNESIARHPSRRASLEGAS